MLAVSAMSFGDGNPQEKPAAVKPDASAVLIVQNKGLDYQVDFWDGTGNLDSGEGRTY